MSKNDFKLKMESNWLTLVNESIQAQVGKYPLELIDQYKVAEIIKQVNDGNSITIKPDKRWFLFLLGFGLLFCCALFL